MFPLRSITRHVSRLISSNRTCSLSTITRDSRAQTQVYVSKSRSPYVNLTLENQLLNTTPPDSTILFLYTNRPSIVIGRNQNPWLEVNIPLAQSLHGSKDAVDLVRRYSGGGTVFHDEGNVNYSVICPPAKFHRDTHAEMVVRALRRLGVQDVAVNCRHDIVMTSPSTPVPASACTDKPVANAENMYKISGSAYKLIRSRSLHHGTCLLSSPNLPRIGSFLRSPAEPFITARGVESVRSRIRNVGIEDTAQFEQAVVEEFGRMYGAPHVQAQLGEDDVAKDLNVRRAIQHLQSPEWVYGQTPLFTFSSDSSKQDSKLPARFQIAFEARHGVVQKFSLSGVSSVQSDTLAQSMLNTQIWKVGDWTSRLRDGNLCQGDALVIGEWMNSLFGKTQA